MRFMERGQGQLSCLLPRNEFIEYLKARNLDVCGESGEFHTFVTAGPLFKGKIDILRSEVAARDGFWFLQVLDHNVIR